MSDIHPASVEKVFKLSILGIS